MPYGTYGEADLAAPQASAALATPGFVARGGPAWLAGLDLSRLPVRQVGS